MGDVAKRSTYPDTGREWHVGTGKLPVEPHEPQWSDRYIEAFRVEMRQSS